MQFLRDHLRIILALALVLIAVLWWGWDRIGPRVVVPENFDELDPEVAAIVREASDALRWRRGDEKLRRQLGMVYEANSMPRYARHCYEQVLQASPDDMMTWYRLGYVHLRTGDFEGAIHAMGRVIQLDPQLDAAWAQRGLWRLDAGDELGAQEDLQHAAELDPGNEAAQFGLTLLELDRRMPSQAIARLHDHDLLDGPNAHYAYRLLGNAQRQLGDLESAEAALARAGGLRPDWHDPWAAQLSTLKRGTGTKRAAADAMMAAGRHQDALPLLRRAVQAEPENLRLQNTMAICLRNLGRDQECLDLLATMHQRAARDYWTNLNIADSLWLISTKRQVDLDQALHHVDLAIEVRPNAGDAHRAKGRLLMAMGQKAQAIDVLKQAFQLDARDPSTLTQAGFLECDLQRWNDARRTFQRALHYEVRSATPTIGLAMAYVGLGDVARAESLLIEARSRRIDHPTQMARLEHLITEARNKQLRKQG
jgi:tetratricopeptide (TPR) repeat protein